MATKYWTGGAGDNNFATAGNWSTGTAPTTGDVCVLATDPASGVDNIGFGDRTSLGLISLIVGPNWSGDIGTTQYPLILELDVLEYAGQGSAVHLKCGSTTTSKVAITDTGSGELPLRLGGTNTITELTMTDARGTVLIDGVGGRVITTVNVIGARRTAVLDLTHQASSAISGTTAKVNGGVLKIDNNFTNVEVSGTGNVEVTGSAQIGTLDIYSGVAQWKTSGTESSISALNVYSGQFEADQCTATVSTIAATQLYETATINEQNGIEGIVWSGGITVNGGTLQLDPGRLVTVS